MVKILISYNMQQGKEKECQEYLVNKLAPGLGRLGFRFADVWYTIWGKSPQILGGGELEDLGQAQKIFHSAAWDKMKDELEPIIDNFTLRVVQARPETPNMN